MANLDLNEYIEELRRIPKVGKYHAQVLERLQDAVNNIATLAGVPATGTMEAPPTINKLNVKSDGAGTFHATIEDNNEIRRGIHYFVEYQQLGQDGKPTDGFIQPHVVPLGTSRSMNPLTLPAMDDNGNPVTYIFHGYSQYRGGAPGAKVHFGGTTPEPLSPGGTVRMSLLPSTGSGTAQPTGQQPGVGFGNINVRPQSNPTSPRK